MKTLYSVLLISFGMLSIFGVSAFTHSIDAFLNDGGRFGCNCEYTSSSLDGKVSMTSYDGAGWASYYKPTLTDPGIVRCIESSKLLTGSRSNKGLNELYPKTSKVPTLIENVITNNVDKITAEKDKDQNIRVTLNDVTITAPTFDEAMRKAICKDSAKRIYASVTPSKQALTEAMRLFGHQTLTEAMNLTSFFSNSDFDLVQKQIAVEFIRYCKQIRTNMTVNPTIFDIIERKTERD